MNRGKSHLAQVLPDRLRQRLDVTGKSMRAVSLAIGAHAGYVRDLFDPERFNVPGAARLHALAEELETTTDYLLGEAESPDQVPSEVAFADGRKLDFGGSLSGIPGIPLLGTGDCSEDLIVKDTDSGQEVRVERASFDPDFHVRMIARPPALLGVPDLYAIFFVGESMRPRFEPGEPGIVDPRRPVRAGDYVLVQLTDGGRNADGSPEVTSVIVKRLVRRTEKEWVLEQYNPPATFALPRRAVARVHRILRPEDMLF